MLLHSFFFLEFLFVFYQWQIVTKAQSLTNPIFWQVPVVFNTSNPLDQGSLVISDSYLAVSPDFQVINTGDDGDYEHKRLLIDMANGCNSNTNFTTIQQWNDQLLTSAVIQSLPKMALIERGYCTWHRKVSAVNYLSSLYHLNIEAMMIYDNSTHGSNASFELRSVDTNEPATPPPQQQQPLYSTPLPPSRNITHMKDNDISLDSNSSSNSNYFPVYFTTKYHGLYLKQLNPSYSSTATKTNISISDLHQLYQLSPYLSTATLNGNKNSDSDKKTSGFPNVLATSKGYLSYIIALVATFLIGVILLRWWRLRKIRRQVAAENSGHGIHADYILQSQADLIDPLPVPVVNDLPIVYYTVAVINNAMCVICLDDYVENKSQVRMLPCRHAFCVLCIDPWLSQKSSFCPICKYDCLPSDQRLQRERQQQPIALSSANQHTVDMTDAVTSITATPTTTGNGCDQPSSPVLAQNNEDVSCAPQNNFQHHL